MHPFYRLEKYPDKPSFSKEDTLIVFGEVFDRGYVNGIVDEAIGVGAKIIYSTVGRRNQDGSLRPLNEDELKDKSMPLINIPLEAGFDMEKGSHGIAPIDELKPLGLTGWKEAKLNWQNIESARLNARQSFHSRVRDYIIELKKLIPQKGKLLFVHTMAGGFPRAKVVMPIANKVFKGTGDRYLSSEVFWQSDIGKLCDLNFKEVTAYTLKVLIDETKDLRQSHEVSYVAYGYHGNEVLQGNDYAWYSYSPYLQGWAKIELENTAYAAKEQGINATVYNVPEILTNSSSIFLGVEVVLYPLLKALKKEAPNQPQTLKLLKMAQEKLKEGFSLSDVEAITQTYLNDPLVKSWPKFDGWPQHNGPEQMLKMRETSIKLIEMHKDSKDLMTAVLSEVVFRACGKIMLRTAFEPERSTMWIGHKIIAELFSCEDFKI
jgi:hypothetical protein